MKMSLSSFTGPINGPCVVFPAEVSAVSHVLICLHGFGSSGDDLIALAPALHASLGKLAETFAVYSPNAPSPTPFNQGYQWFRDMGWTFRDPENLHLLAPQLDSFIEQVAQTHNLPTTRIALLGFSQGAMTVLHTLPSLTHQPAGVIACAGALTVPPAFPATPPTNLPPILFLHGTEDDVLPADTSVQAEATFKAHGYPTELHLLENLGHGLNPAALAHISVFLQALWNPAE